MTNQCLSDDPIRDVSRLRRRFVDRGRRLLVWLILPTTLAMGGPLPSGAQPAGAPIQQLEQGYALQSPEQLDQLTAPIALYPDSLVAQILAASTFPAQIVEADRWLAAHPDLRGEALAQAVDQQRWDPSVKALTAFPSVLGNMDKNIAWTSSLGDAYYNQQPDVMESIQTMRDRAMQAGTLKTTPQQTVVANGSTIIVQSANPNVVYVPAYNPWVVYGAALTPWSNWYAYPGIWYGGPYLSFGLGFGMGPFLGFGWGWPYWGFNWGSRVVIYRNHPYHSRSTTFYNRSAYYRGGGARGVESTFRSRGAPGGRPDGRDFGRGQGVFNRPGGSARPFGESPRAARGYGTPEARPAARSGAFSGYGQGGEARSYSSRGRASSGGGGFSGGSRSGGGFGGGRGGGGGRGR